MAAFRRETAANQCLDSGAIFILEQFGVGMTSTIYGTNHGRTHGNNKKVLYEIVFYFDADTTPTIKRLVVGNVYELIQGAVELGQ